MNNFFETKLHDTVKIAPKMLTKLYEINIAQTLKHKYEGICSKFGYIKHDSIQLLKVNLGELEMATFHGYVRFNVVFMAKICNPAIGSFITCTVKNTNSFGILCTSGIYVNNKYCNVLNVVVPKMNESSNTEYLDKINIGDEVNIEILGKKYLLNNDSIHIFGKIIADEVPTTTSMNLDLNDEKVEIESVIDDENVRVDEEDVDLDEDENDIENEDQVDDKESFVIEEEEDIDEDVDEDDIELSEDEY